MIRICTGTVTIDAGETIFTLWDGDDDVVLSEITAPAGSPVVIEGMSNFIKSRLSSVSAELMLPHAGPGGAGLATAISAMTPAETQVGTLNARVATVLQGLAVVEANGLGLGYRFDSATADADPGPGRFRLNHADPTLATMMYVDDISASDFAVGPLLARWGMGSSLIKGTVNLSSAANDGDFAGYEVIGAVADGGGYRKIPIAAIGAPSAWADGAEIMISFAPRGDAGDGYEIDAEVAGPPDLSAHENEVLGYRVMVRDLGTDFGAYAGRSGVVALTAGPAWQVVAVYTGPKGDKGDQGNQGWAPQLVIVADGARRVWKLAGYIGGDGIPPTAHVGEFLKGDGTWTATIAQAADVRGPGGTGTVGAVGNGVGIDVDSSDPTEPVISLRPFVGDDGDGGEAGGVPAPAAGDAAAKKFLSAAGGWVAVDTAPLQTQITALQEAVTGGYSMLHVRDERAVNVSGGGPATAGGSAKRVLNTVVHNEIEDAALSSSSILLPAGTYYVEATAPGYYCGKHFLWLRFNGAAYGAGVVRGPTEYAFQNGADGVQTTARLAAKFILGTDATVDLMHMMSLAGSSSNLGSASGFAPEVYADLKAWKLA